MLKSGEGTGLQKFASALQNEFAKCPETLASVCNITVCYNAWFINFRIITAQFQDVKTFRSVKVKRKF